VDVSGIRDVAVQASGSTPSGVDDDPGGETWVYERPFVREVAPLEAAMLFATPLVAGDPQGLGRYQVVGRLGRDSRGVFYLGVSRAGLPVGLRVPGLGWLADSRNRTALARTLVAARRAAAVPGAARILDFDLHAPVPFIAAEYYGGAPLRVVVAQQGPLAGGAVEQLAAQVLTVLASLHARGIEHRGVSPDTVLLGPEEPVLVDPGFGPPAGHDPEESWRFAGPEQLRGEPGRAAADLFGLAATLAFTASGRPPFDVLTPNGVLAMTDAWSADLTALASPLRELVRDCLAPDPGQRPTAAEALARLGSPVPAVAAGRFPGGRPPR
jgi:serine/threonine protein kinase